MLAVYGGRIALVFLRRVTRHVRRQDWFAVFIDFLIVVVGIYIGLQASDWAQGAQDRATERRYLERLFADAQENVKAIQDMVAMHERRAGVFVALESSLKDGTAAPTAAELSEVMCRWFVQPVASLQRSTYAELVASGKLALLRDERLRLLLARENEAHATLKNLELLVPAIQRAAEPVNDHRTWYIERIDGKPARTHCRFDFARMRGDKRMPSVAAQLFRDQKNYQVSREDELKAVRAVEQRLMALLGLP